MIRDTTESDLAEIAAIFNAGLHTTTCAWTELPYTASERAQWFARQTQRGDVALVAVEAGAVVGCASYGDFRDSVRWPGYRFTVEHSIHVREDHWGRGIGRTLLSALMDRARDQDKHVMVAGVDGDNVASLRFHERLGFSEVGRMPEIGEKFGRRLDLVLMQRVLDPLSTTSAG